MKKITVIGAGVMGSVIAQVFAAAGNEVVLIDQTKEKAEHGKELIDAALSKTVKRGKLTEDEKLEIMNRVSASDKYEDAAGSDITIEAIFENKEAKQAILSSLEKVLNKDDLIVSNTSSLSVTEIANTMQYPERFAGMHFFNPPTVMKLIEVISGMHTTQETTERVAEIARSLGKTPVFAEDSAGFVANRILIPMINEAIGVYAEGVASAADIDTAMKLGANHPMGPLALGDMIGLDVVLAIMKVLQEETGDDKYRPHPLLRKMVRAGKLGKKTGSGFFDYKRKKSAAK